jgi:hypothetical protein
MGVARVLGGISGFGIVAVVEKHWFFSLEDMLAGFSTHKRNTLPEYVFE